MSDFYQHHHFTTLHRLARLPLEEFEAGLERAARRRRMALLLPSLASEMDGEALPLIRLPVALPETLPTLCDLCGDPAATARGVEKTCLRGSIIRPGMRGTGRKCFTSALNRASGYTTATSG